MFLDIIYICLIYVYKKDLALNNLRGSFNKCPDLFL